MARASWSFRTFWNFATPLLTSRDRPKSAPYPRLKNSKRTSKFQSILFYSTNFFLKKVSQRRKKWRSGPFGIFLYPVCRKTQKNWRGDPFGEIFFQKKSRNAEKNWKGDPLVSSGIVCYAGNFLVLFPGPTGEIWNFVELLIELFWSVQVVLKKTLTKSHDYSRLFSLEKRRLKIAKLKTKYL